MAKFSSTLMGLLAAAALASSGLAFAAEPGMKDNDGMLTDHHGATLYTFDKDADGKSACNDKCAINWPPLTAKPGDKASGKWTIIKRDDGSMQWAYEGKPVYFYKDDKKAGDMTGDGKGGAWHIIKP
ncbi:COG4315 family predicted lipoprotein [Pseudomonas sp. DWP3-1-2]|jgi:predicted lipoprotein with Yx(FWY)xxD motif|uniref:COG4315 family predicted lipoprotein n=1 Tax=Pseudomonas sp. DWP3-1-2 TaxID=2804645 RepID=UPI003CF9DF29